MKLSPLKNFLLTILFFISCSCLFAQKLEPKRRVLEADTTISSKIMGKNYQLYISFPRSYSTKDTIKYPVLYLLDGRLFFPLIKSAREAMDLGGELEQVIIVSIGSGLDGASWYVNRMYDYTTSKDTVLDRKDEKELGFPKGTLQSGGAEKFLQCISKEIIPYMDLHYKTNLDRGIAGHSLGGLFVTYCLLHSKNVFTRYGISSPSLWWNNNEIGNEADSFFSKNATWDISPVKIFMSVGLKEGPLMVPTMTKFSSLLEEKAYKNVTLTWHVFDDETHLSVIPANLSRTLSVLYGTKK